MSGPARPEQPFISIVVPAYNEEGCIDEMLSRLRAVLAPLPGSYELIFVNDGSTDRTLELLRAHAEDDERIRFVSFSRNFGHQRALSCGIDHARGDAVITLDGDLQHPPELIPTLIEHWQSGKDIVYTIRAANEGHAVKEAVSSGFYWVMRKLTGVDVPTGGADFRLVDRRVAEALRSCDEHYMFIRGLVPWLGFDRQAVLYEASERFAGETKYVLSRMIRFAFDGIFAFSIVPLRLISLLGVLTVTLGGFYALYSIYVRLFTDQAVSGWTSLVVIVLVFSGTQLLSLGILSEYVGRIYEEIKRRPRYVVAERSPGFAPVDDRELQT